MEWTTNGTLTWNESYRNHRIIIECAADPQCCVTRYGFPRCWWPQCRRWWPLLLRLLLLLLPVVPLPCVCELSLLGCNSFPYLDHCGDLVCGDRQQSFSSSAVHSCAAAVPALVPLAVCSRRRRHCQRRAVHSITIICLCRESSLSWFTVLSPVQLVWQQRSLLLAATDWISNCSIFGCRFVAISSAGAASEKRNYVIPAINCMFLRHPPAPTCSGDHHVCGKSNRNSSIPSEDRALRRVIKKAPKKCCSYLRMLPILYTLCSGFLMGICRSLSSYLIRLLH